ncbi:MAG: hypothetical protein RLZZ350_2427 [Verrucomicrobiota bacterium]
MAFVALLFVSATNSRADEKTAADLAETNLMAMSFEQLLDINVEKTTTASRYQQTLAQAPASVSIVTHDEIVKLGHRSLAEILSGVRGLYVAYDRNYTYLGVRGFSRPGDYNSRILVLVDGQRVNDGIFDQAPLGTDFPVDVDLIDRVEVVRGPSSAVYGNNAFFGVINVITRRGAQLNGVEASLALGSWETWHGRFSYGKKFANDLELLFSGSFHWSEGQSQLYFPEFNTSSNNVNNGVASHMDQDHAHNYLLSLNYHDWTIEGVFSTREKIVPTAAYATDFNNHDFKTTDQRALFDVKYHHTIRDNTEVNAKTYFDHYDFVGDYPTLGVITRDKATADAWGGELQIAHHLGQHTFSAGVELRKYFSQNQDTFTVNPYNSVFDNPQSELVVGGFAQANLQLCRQVTLDAGGRFDYFERFGDSLNPRLALIYQPVEATTFKALYGTAFRAPNAYELYYCGTGFDPAKRKLQPEKITTYEGVWEQQVTKWLRFSTSGFYYEVCNLIEQTINPGNGLLTFQNLDEAKGYGAEFELEARHHSGALARVSYTEARTENSMTKTSLVNSPRHLAKFTGLVPLYRDKIFAGVEVQYTASVHGQTGADVGDYWLVNFNLYARELAPGLEISAGLYNVFDAHYAHVGSTEHLQNAIPQNGRNFRVQLTYRY